MARTLKEEDLPELSVWLDGHLPYSLKVLLDAQGRILGHRSELDFWVDKWPDPQAVLSFVNIKTENRSTQSPTGVWATSKAKLTLLLKDIFDSLHLDLKKPMKFHCVADHLTPAVLDIAEAKGLICRVTSTCFLMKATPQTLKYLPVPEGMTASPVTEDTIRTVDSNWKFTSPTSLAYLRRATSFYPSVVLKTSSGDHVGHMIGQGTLNMGTLFVLPEFRRQGHAKVIVSQLAQRFFESGAEAVYVMIEDDNQASVLVHQAVGFDFEGLPDSRFTWIACQRDN